MPPTPQAAAPILFFDDDIERHRKFLELCELAGLDISRIRHAYRISRALELLGRERFAWAFLDHDLDGQVLVKPGPNTGLAVAQHIAAMPEAQAPARIVVHSYSPDGARAMMEALQVLEGRAVEAYWRGDEFHRLIYEMAGWKPIA